MLSKTDFMQQALSLGWEGMRHNTGGPFGALVVKDGVIIGKGQNRVTSTNDPTAHAEIVAIREACDHLGSFQLHGCEIYATCEPCPMCLGAIYWARPAMIYYACTRHDAALIGFDDEFIYNELIRQLDMRTIPMEQLLRTTALELFDAWTKKEDRIEY
jgi:tRNA(Arg) A34 adenosine deaminase TadA